MKSFLADINSDSVICIQETWDHEGIDMTALSSKITLSAIICDTASTLIDNVFTNALDKTYISGIFIRLSTSTS